MGPLSKRFNFHLRHQLKEAKLPPPSYDDGEEEDEDESDRYEQSENEEESGSDPDDSRATMAPRKKSFFSIPKKKAGPHADSQALSPRKPGGVGKKKGGSLKIFRKPFKTSNRSMTGPREALSEWQENNAQMSFRPHRAAALDTDGDVPHVVGNERLAAFERGTFDLGEELKGLGEKGINELREQLSDANKECSEKIKRLLHQHYQAFISASKGIRAMDGEMQSLRAFLNKEHGLLNSIKEIADPQGRFADRNLLATTSGREWTRSWADSPEGVRWHNSLQELDLAIAERDPAQALPMLKRTEKALLPGMKSGLVAAYSTLPPPQGEVDAKTTKQAQELSLRRQQLADLVTVQISGSAIGSKEMQVATQVLASLLGRADALKKHLKAHTVALKKNIGQLLKPQNSGGDADGTEFSNALAQQVFGAIAAASEDVAIIFGKDLKDLASLFLVWALSETEKCALMLKRHALSPFAAPAGLGPTMACCLLAYIHCLALQPSHGLRLTSRLMRDLWPVCDQVMQRRVKRIVEDVKAAVGAEVETIIAHGLPAESGGEWTDLMQVFPSADLLLDELEAVVNIMTPMGGPRIREALSQSVTLLFREYTNAMSAQFNHYRYEDGTLPKVLDDSIEMALEVTHSLVEQFLPELAQPLQERCGDICNLRLLNNQLTLFQDRLLPQESDRASSGSEESEEEEEEEGTPVSDMRGDQEWRQRRHAHPLYRASTDLDNNSMDLAEKEFWPLKSAQGLASDVSLGTASTRSSDVSQAEPAATKAAEAPAQRPVVQTPPVSERPILQNRMSNANGQAPSREAEARGNGGSRQAEQDRVHSSPEISSGSDSMNSYAKRNPPLTPRAVPDPRVAEKIALLSKKLGDGLMTVPDPRNTPAPLESRNGSIGRYKPAGWGGLSDGAVGSSSFARREGETNGAGPSRGPGGGQSGRGEPSSGREFAGGELPPARPGKLPPGFEGPAKASNPQTMGRLQETDDPESGEEEDDQDEEGEEEDQQVEREESQSVAGDDEIEEMNEELSDYDDDELAAQLMAKPLARH